MFVEPGRLTSAGTAGYGQCNDQKHHTRSKLENDCLTLDSKDLQQVYSF